MPLDIKVAKAKVDNVNLGNEGQGENQISRLDMKFEFTTTADVLKSLLNIAGDGRDIYWRDDHLIDGMSKQAIITEWNHNKLSFGVFESLFDDEGDRLVEVENCRVKNAMITPMPNFMVEVTLTVQIRDPDQHTMYLISAYQKKDGKLHIKFDDLLAKNEEKKNREQDQIDLE